MENVLRVYFALTDPVYGAQTLFCSAGGAALKAKCSALLRSCHTADFSTVSTRNIPRSLSNGMDDMDAPLSRPCFVLISIQFPEFLRYCKLPVAGT